VPPVVLQHLECLLIDSSELPLTEDALAALLRRVEENQVFLHRDAPTPEGGRLRCRALKCVIALKTELLSQLRNCSTLQSFFEALVLMAFSSCDMPCRAETSQKAALRVCSRHKIVSRRNGDAEAYFGACVR
jgi:hypothetical protein